MHRLRLRLSVFTLGHFLVDLHSGMLPVILIYQRQALGLSLAQVGAIAGVYNFGLTQPLFGHLADRFGETPFAAGAMLWISAMGASLGFAPSFTILLLCAGFQSFGSAAYHPTAASGAGRLATGKRGFSMSVFLSGGSLGTTLGPMIAALVIEATGLHGTAWIGLGAFSLALVLATLLSLRWPAGQVERALASSSPSQPEGQPARLPLSGVFLLSAVALLVVTGVRTWVHQSLNTYLPQYLAAQGYSALDASRWLSVMLAAATLGILVGGPLSDRFGPRAVCVSALAGLAVSIELLARHLGLVPLGFLVALAGFSVGLPLPMTLVVGQALLARSAGLASGLVLGTSFVFGALGVMVTGLVADADNLSLALLALSGLSPGLPKRRWSSVSKLDQSC
jgi:FSR family fosmidomycin resistance protein-like MFS transporter